VDKFENGIRQTDPRIGVPEQFTTILQVPLERLQSDQEHCLAVRPQAEAAGVSRAGSEA
jgi:hypothetical protein